MVQGSLFYHPSSLFCGIIDSRDLWEYTVTKYYENVLLRLQGSEEGNQLGKKSLVMLGFLLHVEVEMKEGFFVPLFLFFLV